VNYALPIIVVLYKKLFRTDLLQVIRLDRIPVVSPAPPFAGLRLLQDWTGYSCHQLIYVTQSVQHVFQFWFWVFESFSLSETEESGKSKS
jgi:hypothetical protein